jgi:hypothetical protein
VKGKPRPALAKPAVTGNAHRRRQRAPACFNYLCGVLISAATLLAVPPVARAQAPAPTLRYAPATILDNITRDVVACGVRIDVLAANSAEDASPALQAVLRQRRVGDATRVEWCARRPASAAGHELPTASSATAAVSAGVGEKVTLQVHGIAKLSVTLPSAAGTEHCSLLQESSSLLFQRLFVTGGSISLPASAVGVTGEDTSTEGSPSAETPAVLTLPLARPLPIALSRNYLNCAGDLYRPEDDLPPEP